jgi:hypothetical protein
MGKTFHYGDWEYKKNIGSHDITISKYLGSDTEVTVPAQIKGMNVYDFNQFVFSASPHVARVIFLEGIQRILSGVLALSNIQEVVLPSTLQEIKGAGFNEVVEQVTVSPDNPLFFDIDGILFSRENENKHLVYFPAGRTGSTYKIPDGTTHINWLAFNASKNLEHVIMPDSVVGLDYSVFKDCPKLVSVRLSPNIEELKRNTFYNCIALSNVRSSRKIRMIDSDAFDECPEFRGINIQTRMSEQER